MNREKTIDIFMRKNSRSTLTAKKLIETPQLAQWQDSLAIQTGKINRNRVLEAVANSPKKEKGEKMNQIPQPSGIGGNPMYHVRIPLILTGEKLHDYSNTNNLKFFFYFFSNLPEINWIKSGTYVAPK